MHLLPTHQRSRPPSYTGEVSTAPLKPVQWLGKFGTTLMWCNSSGTDCKLRNMAPRPYR